MSSDQSLLTVREVSATVLRKPIKNLHIGVYPPDGRVRVAAPEALSDSAVRAALVRRLAWIRRRQAEFRGQARETTREYVSGESHWFLGRRYRLRVVEQDGKESVNRASGSIIELRCRAGASRERRAMLMDRWYRQELRTRVPSVLDRWTERLGPADVEWRARRMKTKWGSASSSHRRIWLNPELMKKPERCLEYVVVHELAHLVERRHGDRFRRFMD
ncbi:SprT family zinc-dependent metalloprotease, partial [Microbacterium sp.]|uniref:M48 family metallopeptidase n=1 Tax=Microbacterium sp. TaxID=51671 RepID=UPI0031FEFC84|nr:M48 family metallopeptidase [Microbacterium sp.]